MNEATMVKRRLDVEIRVVLHAAHLPGVIDELKSLVKDLENLSIGERERDHYRIKISQVGGPE